VQLLKKETEKLGDLGKKVRRGENWLEIISFDNQLKQLKSFILEVSLLVRTVLNTQAPFLESFKCTELIGLCTVGVDRCFVHLFFTSLVREGVPC